MYKSYSVGFWGTQCRRQTYCKNTVTGTYYGMLGAKISPVRRLTVDFS